MFFIMCTPWPPCHDWEDEGIPMKEWKTQYADRIKTVDEAIRMIEPGQRILIGSNAAEPSHLVQGLVENGTHLRGNEIVHLLTLGPAPYVALGLESRFHLVSFFIGGNVRAAVQEGRADFVPIFLSELPALIRSGRRPVDVALIKVSPPDAHGYVSLGVTVDIVRAAVETAKLVIAEVNDHMPRTHGASMLHIDQLHALIPTTTPLSELITPPADDVSNAIAAHIANQVPDGATIQMGIGKIPDAVLCALHGKKDLGIHSEMISDGVIDLVKNGVVNGRKKTLLPGKIVVSFIMGTKRLYDWVHDNPAIEMRPSDFTNDPMIIARNDTMIAINSALAVDLTGQVAADTVRGKFFSGIGGQVDFIRGSARSKGGCPIIALPSTARSGSVSRIQCVFEEGTGVVTSRGDVHMVITEYGVAELWGRSIRERAESLIKVAHPKFREELRATAHARRYL